MTRLSSLWTLGVIALLLVAGSCRAEDDGETVPKVDQDLGAEREGSRTDDGVVQREEEAIKIDGLNVAQIKELRAKAEKHHFQAEVNRMMKLIINSLYKNKEIFLRELISNASDALDKLRLLSLTDKSALEVLEQFAIRIRADKENHKLDITDTGIGMTKEDLIKNLGTIAKSGTSDFLNKMQEASDTKELNDLIGQFGVGFYSSFLVADNVVVTSKAYGDGQYIWESDASKFSVVEDPRGDTLKRGTQVSLQMKPEAMNYLEEKTLKDLIIKYSQFINFPIYLWTEKTIEEEVPVEEDEAEKKEEKKDDDIIDDDDAKVEEAKDEDKPKTKKVSKTVYDWELINNSKPIWTRKPGEVEDKEYNDFYKTLTKDATEPLAKTHFIAEGEVTFKALLYVPKVQPGESFNRYGTRTDNIKLYVRRVFITDDFHEMMPNYLSFIRGVVDSDDLPLNVSRETLQQNKLIKIIRKKLIRKVLDMLKKLEPEEYDKFWKEYSTNIKLGVIEDTANKSRLAKLLRFFSSNGSQTSLSEYVSRMKDKQEAIYYIAGASKDEVEKSPFVERLLKKGYEVLYLVEAVDEYTIGALPEFEGKKFQNVAKEGLSLSDSKKSKEKLEETKKMFEPLTKWLSENALKDQITRAEISERLSNSPCALVAGMFAWTGNMERMALSNPHQKADDIQKTYYLNQKKTLEVNPRHPLIKELLRRVKDDAADDKAKEIALMMFRTATLRSGYMLKDTVEFADTVEQMMRQTLGVPADEEVEEDDTLEEEEEPQDQEDKDVDDEDKDETEADSTTTGSDDHDEL